MNKKTYTGSKIQNHFTAYLIQFVRGKRHDYLEKKIQICACVILLIITHFNAFRIVLIYDKIYALSEVI